MIMICAGYGNANIMTAAECFVNIVKVVRHDTESCSRDSKAMASRKSTQQMFCFLFLLSKQLNLVQWPSG